jgi:hypothetical protein
MSKALPTLKADNFTARSEPIVKIMQDPQYLTTFQVFTACTVMALFHSFTFRLIHCVYNQRSRCGLKDYLWLVIIYIMLGIPDSEVSIVMGYRSAPRVRFQLVKKGFLLHIVHIGVSAQSPFVQWEPAACSLGVKRQRRETDHSYPSTAKVNRVWAKLQIWYLSLCVALNYLSKHNFSFTYKQNKFRGF